MSGLAQAVEEDYRDAANLRLPEHVFVEVEGGVVMHTDSGDAIVHVIDWDALETDIVEAWEKLGRAGQQYISQMHVDRYIDLVAQYNRAKPRH